MGNNGSSSYYYQHQCTSNALSKFKKTGPGFSHTLSNQYSKKKILRKKGLPEPNDGNSQDINIHSENTASIHGTLALTLPHNLNKIKFNEPCQNIGHHHNHQKSLVCKISPCKHCVRIMPKSSSTNQDKEISKDLKKFKSEPDLRYLMTHKAMLSVINSQHYFDDQEMQEKEIRYRYKKKYKAPLPPLPSQQCSSKAPSEFQNESEKRDVCIEENTQKDDYFVKFHLMQKQSSSQPLLRKTRLFKSQSKISQIVNDDCSLCSNAFFHGHSIVPDKTKYEQNFLQDMVIDQDDDHHDGTVQNQENKSLLWSSGRYCGELKSCSNSSNSSSGLRRRRRFLNWKNANILEKKMTPKNQSELIQQPLKKIRTTHECFEKGFSMKEAAACNSVKGNMSMEINQLQLNKFQNCPPMTKSHQREKIKSICINKGNSETRKEFRNQKCDNNNHIISVTTDEENVDKNLNLSTKNQQKQYISKSHIDDAFLELKNIKNNNSFTCINDFNSKLLNDRNSESLCSNKSQTEKENQVQKDKIQIDSSMQNVDNKINQSIKKSRYLDSNFLILRKETANIRKEDESEEENYLKKSFKNKRINTENLQLAVKRQKDNLKETSCNKEQGAPLVKTKVGAEIQSSYLNQSNRNTIPIFNYSKLKTFYFGMDKAKEFNQYIDYQEAEEISADLLKTNFNSLVVDNDEVDKLDNEKIDIALRLRPTLPKKPPEVPRFSPSDAWKLLTALETFEPAMSTVSDEPPVVIEEEKEEEEEEERLPYPSSHLRSPIYHEISIDKSGDSGISGDAGCVDKVLPSRTTWTPQQDLDEDESSNSDVLYNCLPHELKNPIQLRPHVFSLSLPREENKSFHFRNEAVSIPTTEPKTKDMLFSDSLQKLKRSVSGALGFTPVEPNTLDDNWFLSSSAPTSLQNYYTDRNDKFNACQSRLISIEDSVENEGTENENYENTIKTIEENSKSQLTSVPFSSNFISKGHVMYLPDTGSRFDANLNLPFQKKQHQLIKYKKHKQNGTKNTFVDQNACNYGTSPLSGSSRQFSKSCENISYDMGSQEPENVQNVTEKKEMSKSYMNDVIKDINNKIFNLNRPRKFTFQSTVRQIERRRLAEKLSKEAEAKEKQRRNELEAMIKVEEEFQRKRNKEKANIRHQLRYFNMDKNAR